MSNFIFIDESGDPGKPFKKIDNKEKVATGASLFYILKLHNVFDEYNLAKLTDFAIKKGGFERTEIVIDRAERRLLYGKFDNFNDYLKNKVNTKTIERVKYVTHVDSEYVNAMQLSDLISGALKDYFTGKNKDLRNVINKKYLYKIY